MNMEKLKEFTEICKEIIVDTTNYEVIDYTAQDKGTTFLCSDVAIVFGISGSVKGQVVFTLSEINAIKIASKMFPEIEITEFDEIARCSISEFGNIILGRAIQVFSDGNSYVDITPPALATGTNLVLHVDRMTVREICMTLSGDNETFDINISICEKK